jgi:hypothetical protein
MTAKKNNKANLKAALGRKYYDVVDTYTSKILSKLIEESVSLGIDRENLKTISAMLEQEKAQVKNWGFDQISNVIK